MSRSIGTSDAERRRFLKLAVVGLAAAPFASTWFAREARATDALQMLDEEKDPTALALAYRCEAAKAPARKDPDAFCDNCILFTPDAEKKAGPCRLFPGKLVCAKGWCTSYAKQPA